MMRVLVVHNAYQQKGGEDTVVANETKLLREAGFEVELLQTSNDMIRSQAAAARAAVESIYSRRGKVLASEAIRRFRPNVMHVHNFFPLLSPSIFYAARDAGVRTVWTLHNFRVSCANGLLFRDGKPCEQCLGGSPLPAITHRCYRGSASASAAMAASIAFHRARGTWSKMVDCFIALSDFSRDRFVAGGLPPEKIVVKPNFAPDAGTPIPWSERQGAIYVGRLSPEKGVSTLLQAWREIDLPLTVVGDGPLRRDLEDSSPANVRFMGHLDAATTARMVGRAKALIFPSLAFETFGQVIAEAFSHGTPVIASDHGSAASLVKSNINGLLFRPADAADLRTIVRSAFGDEALLRQLHAGSRGWYKRHLSPQASLSALLRVYTGAVPVQRAA